MFIYRHFIYIMSKNYIIFSFICLIYLINIISSSIILPFNYKNKKETEKDQNSIIDSKTLYFESKMDNTIYTSMKVYNQYIDFHLSMERYPIYISDEIYQKFNDTIDPKKISLTLYSLSQIGIERAALINKTITVKSNTSSENIINEINLFRARKFLEKTDEEKMRMGYASEDAEIGLNIVRGSQFIYVEETENDLDIGRLKEEFEAEKQRQKAYEEYYGLNKNQNNDNEQNNQNNQNKDESKKQTQSYNPLNENDYISDYDDIFPKRPYDDDVFFNDDDHIEIKNNKNNKTTNGKNNKNENKKEKESKKEVKENERFMGDGTFKEESANFISQLKKKDKINSYVFTIKYNSKEDENGMIIIGDLPHEYSPDIFSSENYFFDTVKITKEPPFNWHFTYKKCLYDQIEIDGGNNVKFSIDFGFLKGNNKLQKYLEQNFFNDNINNNLCHKETTKNNFDVYYCQEKAIKNFKPLTFKLESKYCTTNVNAKFEFTYEDLFIKDNSSNNNNGIYYFQIVFPSKGLYSNWVFGKPLFKKYQMVFDQDRKTYGFYLKMNNKDNNGQKLDSTLKISWTLIIILILVSIILGYLLCKLIRKLPRRLKANELEDDFSYVSSTSSKYNQIQSNNEINGKNKLYENL